MSSDLPLSLLQRKAVVYVRQSTSAQVEGNLESQRRQYELVARAQSLGFVTVDIIDDDLGVSASGFADRPGFENLVGQICTGSVGGVFCLEASRLSRNGQDWHRLLELCALVGTRVFDADGQYDPRLVNDRLLLGMKGTISEFELGLLRSRLNDAMWSKARRGELRIKVPLGFRWEPGTEVTLDPDQRLQNFIRLVFKKFLECGSARQVYLWMIAQEVSCPRRWDNKRTTSFDWEVPRYCIVLHILKNPFYAGAYAFGKTKVRSIIEGGRVRKRQSHVRRVEEWDVLIKGHHEGYITWEDYERNRALLARNTYRNSEGSTKSARGGSALLGGLLRCRRCGCRLRVVYSNGGGDRGHRSRYECRGDGNDMGRGKCIYVSARPIDRLIVGEVLQVVRPVAIEAAVEAARQVDNARQERQRLFELELERARYEANLAERRFAACDPENRLVASTLISSWEAAMQAVKKCEARLQSFIAEKSEKPSATELHGLAAELEETWNDEGVTARTRQRILRTLIEEIILDLDEQTQELVMHVHWKGGCHSEVRTPRRRPGQHAKKASDEALDVIRSMSTRWSDEHIAATLNRLGYRTGQDNTWSKRRVASVRLSLGLPAHKTSVKDGEFLTMSEAAERLHVNRHVIRWLIASGTLPAEQVAPRAPHQIRAEDLASTPVLTAIATRSTAPRRSNAEQGSLFICETDSDA